MNKILLLIVLSIFHSKALSQSSLFINRSNYQSTEELEIPKNGIQKLKIVFAKKTNGSGIIVITDDSLGGKKIKGKLLLYLDDKTIISCIDRGIYDSIDYTTSTAYFLTKDEINKLMSVNIYSIRYSLKSDWGSLENFSAKNIDDIVGEVVLFQRVDFPYHISNLFNQ